jgi:hypothetical protein
MPTDLTEIESSGSTKLTGGDELFHADVIREREVNKLAVKADVEIDSSLRIIENSPENIRLNNVDNGGAFTTIYSSASPIVISGFFIRFDRNQVRVRLEADGELIFDLDMNQLNEYSNLASDFLPNVYVSWNNNKNVFYFTPAFPLTADTATISVGGKVNNADYLGSYIQAGLL